MWLCATFHWWLFHVAVSYFSLRFSWQFNCPLRFTVSFRFYGMRCAVATGFIAAGRLLRWCTTLGCRFGVSAGATLQRCCSFATNYYLPYRPSQLGWRVPKLINGSPMFSIRLWFMANKVTVRLRLGSCLRRALKLGFFVHWITPSASIAFGRHPVLPCSWKLVWISGFVPSSKIFGILMLDGHLGGALFITKSWPRTACRFLKGNAWVRLPAASGCPLARDMWKLNWGLPWPVPSTWTTDPWWPGPLKNWYKLSVAGRTGVEGLGCLSLLPRLKWQLVQKSSLQALIPAEWFRSDITMLGVATKGAPRCNAQQERERLTTAKQRLSSLSMLRLGSGLFAVCARVFALSLCSYRWLSRLPRKMDCDALWIAIKKGQKVLYSANTWLRAMVHGVWIILTSSPPATSSGSCRSCAVGVRRFGPTGRVVSWRSCASGSRLGGSLRCVLGSGVTSMIRPSGCPRWVLIRVISSAWVISSGKVGGSTVGTVSPNVSSWDFHGQSCSGMLRRLTWGRSSCSTVRALSESCAACRTVAVGGTVSPAWFHARDGEPFSSLCPWCPALGSWFHVCWECKSLFWRLVLPLRPWVSLDVLVGVLIPVLCFCTLRRFKKPFGIIDMGGDKMLGSVSCGCVQHFTDGCFMMFHVAVSYFSLRFS